MKRILAIGTAALCICMAAGCQFSVPGQRAKLVADQTAAQTAAAATDQRAGRQNTAGDWVCSPHTCYRMEVPNGGSGPYHHGEHHGGHHGNGMYVPSFSVDEDNQTFIFSYDPLSSYAAGGTYSIEDGILTAVTNDGKYQYRFRIREDGTMTFIQDGSSKIQVTDEKTAVPVTDGAVFLIGQTG